MQKFVFRERTAGRGAAAKLFACLLATACASMLLAGSIANAEISVGGGGGGGGTVAGSKAKLKQGKAIPPANAPTKIKRAIRAANKIAGKPYKYGGGHAKWKDSGYDCSGAVSYAIGKPGAKMLKSPVPSGSLMGWGKPGKGKWITVYANGGHTYAMIAGLRWESHTYGDGPSWSKQKASKKGYKIRHRAGF